MSSCGGSASLVITSSGSNVYFPGTAGTGSCAKAVTFSGTASGSTAVFPTQTNTDACGVAETLSGTGTISGGTLALSLTASNSTASVTCVLTGTK